MEILILMALACWGGTRYAVHTPLRIAERRQRADQSHQLRMARLSKRKGPTLGQAISTRIANRIADPRGGPAREAMALWWADSWGYATDRRLRRHEQAENGQLRRQRAARAAKNWLNTQWADLTGQHGHGNASDEGKVRAEASVSTPSSEAEDIVDAEIVDDAQTAAPRPAESPTNTANDQTPSAETSWYKVEIHWPDGTSHVDGVRADTAEEAQKKATRNWMTETPHNAADHITVVGKGQGPWTGPAEDLPRQASSPGQTTATEHDPDGCLASVHPLHTTNGKEFTVSTPNSTTITSGETLDPAAARGFTAGMEEAARKLYTETELSVSSLSGCGVSGEPISDLSAIQEALSLVIDRARSATAHFDRHLGTQDQVLSDPTLAGAVQNSYLSRA